MGVVFVITSRFVMVVVVLHYPVLQGAWSQNNKCSVYGSYAREPHTEQVILLSPQDGLESLSFSGRLCIIVKQPTGWADRRAPPEFNVKPNFLQGDLYRGLLRSLICLLLLLLR